MEKVGFFGGSFNPPTNAHLEIAKTALEEMELDKVYFVPMGNTYKKPGLIDERLRYEMLQIACAKYEKIDVENIELNLTKSLTTIEAFKRIESKYSKTQNYYIMGADNFEKLPTWKNAKELIENFKYIIFERNGSDSKSLLATQEILKQNKNNFEFLDEKKYSNVSSGIIRELIQNENYKECEKYTKPEIVQYIEEKGLYIQQ